MYIFYVMLIRAALLPTTRWHCEATIVSGWLARPLVAGITSAQMIHHKFNRDVKIHRSPSQPLSSYFQLGHTILPQLLFLWLRLWRASAYIIILLHYHIEINLPLFKGICLYGTFIYVTNRDSGHYLTRCPTNGMFITPYHNGLLRLH